MTRASGIRPARPAANRSDQRLADLFNPPLAGWDDRRVPSTDRVLRDGATDMELAAFVVVASADLELAGDPYAQQALIFARANAATPPTFEMIV